MAPYHYKDKTYDRLIFIMEIQMHEKTISILRRDPEPRLNIKTVFTWYGDSHVKDKTALCHWHAALLPC